MGAFWERQRPKGADKAAHSLLYWLIIHTHQICTNINIPMYKCTRDSQITPISLLQHPNLRPGGSTFGGRFAGGWR